MNMNMNAAASAGTSAGTAKSSVSTAGACQNGSGASATFGKLLVQVVGDSAGTSSTYGNAAGTTASPLTSLDQLLSGILLGDGNGASGDQADVSGASAGLASPTELLEMLSKLSEKPDLLKKLLGEDDMQAWLLQAYNLLQGMLALPSNFAQTAGQNAADPSEATSAAVKGSFTLAQAQGILQAFVQASGSQPNNIFLAQLQEKLAQMLGGTNGATDANQDRSSDTSVEGPKGPSTNEATGTSGVAFRSARQPLESAGGSELIQTVHEGLNGKVQSASATHVLSRLEVLAQKSMLAGKQESAAAPVDQQAGTQADSGSGTLSASFGNVVLTDAAKPALIAQAQSEQATVSAGSFTEDMSKLLFGKLKIQTFGGTTEAKIALNPESLGHVDVKLSMQNGVLTAHFVAQTASGKEMLEAQLPQLRMTLQNQGIQVEKLEVSQSATLGSGMFQEQRGQQGNSSFTGNGKTRYEDSSNGDFSNEIAAAAAIRGGSYDREGFDVTA